MQTRVPNILTQEGPREVEIPAEVVALADREGNELAWSAGVVHMARALARSHGLRVMAGQVQFRGLGTCDMYWRGFDLEPQRPFECWPECVDRSYRIAGAWIEHWIDMPWVVQDLVDSFREPEGGYPGLDELRKNLHVLLYFDTEDMQPFFRASGSQTER